VAHQLSHTITVHRVMTPSWRLQAIACQATDDGSCYKSFAFAATCKALNLRHIRTKPCTPETNRKAERLIQPALREWAHARARQTADRRPQTADPRPQTSVEHKRHLPDWTHKHNWHRPQGVEGSEPAIGRLGLNRDNLWRLHIQVMLTVYP